MSQGLQPQKISTAKLPADTRSYLTPLRLPFAARGASVRWLYAQIATDGSESGAYRSSCVTGKVCARPDFIPQNINRRTWQPCPDDMTGHLPFRRWTGIPTPATLNLAAISHPKEPPNRSAANPDLHQLRRPFPPVHPTMAITSHPLAATTAVSDGGTTAAVLSHQPVLIHLR